MGIICELEKPKQPNDVSSSAIDFHKLR